MLLRLFLLLAIVASLLGCVDHENVKDVLNESLKRCNNNSYEVTIVKKIAIEDRSLKTQKVERGIFKGNKFKIFDERYSVVSNGSIVWMYDNKTGLLIVDDYSRSNEKPKNIFASLILRLMNCSSLSMNVTNDSYIVTGVNKEAVKVWIDRKTFIPRKSEVKSNFYGFNVTYITVFENLTFRKVDESEFNVTFPKVDVIRVTHLQKIDDARKKLNFTIIAIHNPDFNLERIDVIERKGFKAVALQYLGLDGCHLTVIETPQHDLTTKGEEILISGVKVFYDNGIKFSLKNVTINVLSDCLGKQELISVVKSMINGN